MPSFFSGQGSSGGWAGQGGGFGANTINDIAGAASSFLTGQATEKADYAQASADYAEAALYGQEATFTAASTKLKAAAEERKFFMTQGAAENEIASAGFSMSGSGLDIIRENAAQGGLETAIVNEQGIQQEYVYQKEQDAAIAAGNAAESAGSSAAFMGDVTGGIKLAAAAFTLL